jgi:hypothetical protein
VLYLVYSLLGVLLGRGKKEPESNNTPTGIYVDFDTCYYDESYYDEWCINLWGVFEGWYQC